MKAFTPRPDSFIEIQKKTVPKMLAIFGGLFLIAVVVPALVKDDPNRWSSMPVIFFAFVAITGFALYTTLQRQRKSFETYRLTIDDEKLIREQFNTPSITIFKKDVLEIIKNANGSFTVIGPNSLNAIGIPAQIDNYHELERSLLEIKILRVKTDESIAEKLFVPVSLSGAVLIAVTTLTKNPTVNLVCSLLIVMIMLGGMLVILMTRNIDKRTKRLSLIFLIPILSYLVNIISLIS
jgi:hypothetical protein